MEAKPRVFSRYIRRGLWETRRRHRKSTREQESCPTSEGREVFFESHAIEAGSGTVGPDPIDDLWLAKHFLYQREAGETLASDEGGERKGAQELEWACP